MAWKVTAALQPYVPDEPAHADFPGGAYRARFSHNSSVAGMEAWWTSLVDDGRYVLPYLETEGDGPRAAALLSSWTSTLMPNWADAMARAGIEYIEFGNEINSPGTVSARHQLWDEYIEMAKISAPIFRAANVGFMCTSIGASKDTEEWFDYLASKAAFKYFDCMAIHAYSGGTHADGSAAGGLPADSLRRIRDARTALDNAGVGHPEVDMWMTEFGWPSYWAASPSVQPGITDPGHQTYCTEAQQATRLGDAYTSLYANAAANRVRMISWFHSTDYRDGGDPQGPPTGDDTPGNWAHHHGLRLEPGTDEYLSRGAPAHKASWAAFVADAGIGRGTAGVKPELVTGSVTAVGATTATIAGTVDPNGLPTTWRVEVGPDANFGTRTSTAGPLTGTTATSVSKNLTGLIAGTTYHARLTAWNDAGFAWSTKTTFTTTGTGASFWVTPNRSAGTGSTPIATNEPIPSVANPALLPDTTYYYRLVASNNMGVSYGEPESFVTSAPPQAPSVTTGTASAVTIIGANLNGSINPNGVAVTDYHFEYGTTVAYGSSTTAGTLPAGTNDVSVQAPLTGLVQGQTIHYRLVATNSYGTTNGLDRSFIVTAPGVPSDLDPITVLSTLLSVEATTHDGHHYRWDVDNSNVQNRPLSTSFSTQTGDGFAEGSCVLPRPIDLDWPDLNLLDRVRFIAADGSIAYEGRVAGLPRRVDADGEAIEVQLQGLMSSARDRTFMEVYADRSTDRWQQSSLALRVAYADAQHPLDSDYVPQVDTGSFSFKGPTGKTIHVGSQGVLTWRAPAGCKAAIVWYRGDDKGVSIANCFGPALYAKDDDTTTFDDWETKALTFGNTGILRSVTLDTPRSYLGTRLMCETLHTPPASNAAHRIVHRICVYGDHGLTLREASQGPPGVFASDVMANVIERFCPQLNADGVRQTATVISHLTFDTPTTPFDCFTLLNGFHLWTLGAWEDGRVDYGPADLTRADWQVRREDPGVTLDLQGDTTDQFANGIVVSYTDIDERAQVLWPTDYPDQLADLDPDNPANRQGIELWTSLELSNPVTRADALALGEAALAEFNRPKAPGTINVTLGYVEDSRGNLQPGHKVRANQTLSIADLPNDSSRLITATSWNEDGSLQITLEQPPTRIDAVLARLDLSQRSRGIG